MRLAPRFNILASSLLAISAAQAEVVSVQGGGRYLYYDGSAFQDVPFSVSFSYDTAATPITSNSTQAIYSALSFSMTFNIIGDTWTDTTSAAQVAVFSGQFSDGFQVTSEQNPAAPLLGGTPVEFYKIELTGPQSAFSSTALPSSVNLSDWVTGKAVVYTNSFATRINTDLTTLGAAVPEPASYTLLVGGAMLVGVGFRRRARS